MTLTDVIIVVAAMGIVVFGVTHNIRTRRKNRGCSGCDGCSGEQNCPPSAPHM